MSTMGLDSRSTSSASSRMERGMESGLLIRSARVSQAVNPIWKQGWLMVEMAGETIAAMSILSNQIVLRSLGTRNPQRRAARSAVIAKTSELAIIAFGLLELLSSWQIEEYPMS